MDAHNLAVVLSPNILPLSVPGEVHSFSEKKIKNGSPLSMSEDGVLAANIDIMEVNKGLFFLCNYNTIFGDGLDRFSSNFDFLKGEATS